MTKKILIVYHSKMGNTKRLANAVYAGVCDEKEVDVRLRRALHVQCVDFIWADGLLLGTPENFGYMSGAMKYALDSTFDELEPLKLNLPYGVFVSAGNDGTGAVREVGRIVRGFPFKEVLEPLIIRKKVCESDLEKCKEWGQTLAAGLVMGVF